MLQANPFSTNRPGFQPIRQRSARAHSEFLPSVQKPVLPFGPAPSIQPLQGDTLTFSGNSAQRDKIRMEKYRLRQELDGALGERKLDKAYFEARAYYNVKGAKYRNLFNPFLPYRDKFIRNNQSAALKNYDELVDTIMKKAQFYQTPDYNGLMDKLHKLTIKDYLKHELPENASWFTKLKGKIKLKWWEFRMWLSPKFRNKVFMSAAKMMKVKGIQVPQSEIDQAFGQTTKPLDDESSKYLMAASIVELYHQRPEWVEGKLNPKDDRPLKIVFSRSNNKQLIQGQYKFGLNTIWMHGPTTWYDAQFRRLPGHHEFTHCLSEGENGEYLEGMSDSQKKEYKQIREQLKKKDATFFATMLRKITRSKPSCGLPEYAFFNDMEFLPVSLDTFKQAPEKLCKTESGKKLYALYKDLLGIDPLNDLSQAERTRP